MVLPDSAGEVYYGNRTVTFNSGGATAELDHDNLGGVVDAQPNKRVENIVVNGTSVPSGNYTFFVRDFSHHESTPVDATLRVTGNNGQTVQTINLTFTATGENSQNVVIHH